MEIPGESAPDVIAAATGEDLKKYRFETLGMLGQMYDEGAEEVSFPSGTWFYLVSDVESPTAHEPDQCVNYPDCSVCGPRSSES